MVSGCGPASFLLWSIHGTPERWCASVGGGCCTTVVVGVSPVVVADMNVRRMVVRCGCVGMLLGVWGIPVCGVVPVS